MRGFAFLILLIICVSCSKNAAKEISLDKADMEAVAGINAASKELSNISTQLEIASSPILQIHLDNLFHHQDSLFWHHHNLYNTQNNHPHNDHHHQWIPYNPNINHSHHYHPIHPGIIGRIYYLNIKSRFKLFKCIRVI